MPVFADAFGYTPDQFRALSARDHAALRKYLVERQRAAERRR